MLRRSRAQDGGNSGLAAFLGIQFTSVEPSGCTAELMVGEDLLTPFGAAHGAVLASLVDHMLGPTIFPFVPAGTWPATLEFKLNYLAPIRPGILRATSRIMSLRKSTAVVAVECENTGRPVGMALGTIALTAPHATEQPGP
jgi:1,4-dihydroxy-2-naphthoyl-CoA hydrolase